MAGRPRKPTALKRLHGTFQSCRSNPREPMPETYEAPPCPDDASDRVRAEWPRFAANLQGIVCSWDGPAMFALVSAYCDWKESIEELQERGHTVQQPILRRGKVRDYKTAPNPAVAQRNANDRRFRSWCAKFGLTPSDRLRISGVQDQ